MMLVLFKLVLVLRGDFDRDIRIRMLPVIDANQWPAALAARLMVTANSKRCKSAVRVHGWLPTQEDLEPDRPGYTIEFDATKAQGFPQMSMDGLERWLNDALVGF